MRSNYFFVKLSNDPSLSSLPLLTTFLKSYAHPFLGLAPPAPSKQISATTEPGRLAFDTSETAETAFPPLGLEVEDELVEKDIRDRFKKMCEGYFENVAKKLVLEHKVCAHEFLCMGLWSQRPAAVARTRSSEPRSLHPFRGDLRRPPTSLREDDEKL
jgi:hypothetical protein